jgi:hypothetical protein
MQGDHGSCRSVYHQEVRYSPVRPQPNPTLTSPPCRVVLVYHRLPRLSVVWGLLAHTVRRRYANPERISLNEGD